MGNNHYFCFVLYIQINEFFPMYTILIIEDEPRVASLLMNGLEENGYQTMVAYDGLMGLRLFQAHTFDLVISDIVLPKMDGFELAREIRKTNPNIPILMLTALGSTNDKLDGFDAGADDYLGKSFDTRELLARLRALTRRPGTTAESAIRCGDVTLDAAQLTLSGPKAAAALTKREADLLEVLLRTPGQLQTRAVLLARVWGPLAEVEDANLDCYIHFVRRRLKAVGSAVTITTVRGSGYKAEVPPC